MTPKKQAAMQQALEALETKGEHHSRVYEAITALREALAEPQITTPDVCGEVCARAKLCYGCNKDLEEANAKFSEQAEQEPVMIVEVSAMGIPEITWDKFEYYDAGRYELYAAPVRTKDLTDDEIRAIRFNWERNEFAIDFARAVIAADRSKNGTI